MLETNKLFPNSYHRIIFSKVLTYIIANIRKRTPKHYRLKRAQNVNPVSPIHLTNKTHEILFCKATLTMQIFTWYQYVWNSWNPFTFRLKPNWEQPNYPRETRRQVASHKTQKRILTRYLQSIRRGVRSDAQLSSTETRFQKYSQKGKNGSKHPMLSISMAYNVISCKKVERNTQKL